MRGLAVAILNLVTEIDERTDALVPEWYTLPEVAERLKLPVNRVRQLIRDRHLLAFRRGADRVLQVPAEFLDGAKVVKGLPGALTLLADSGYDDAAALRWLFTADDTLPGTPVSALRENRGTEVRRRAQALAF
jgi:hypothetical protein